MSQVFQHLLRKTEKIKVSKNYAYDGDIPRKTPLFSDFAMQQNCLKWLFE